jgi:formylglycine-generating enzyme
MLQRTISESLATLTVLVAVAFATAQEPKHADDDKKQITNSIGMKLTLIPAGDFKMGSGESVWDAAAFFKKNYNMFGFQMWTQDIFKNQHPQHRVRITKPFYLGTYHVTRGNFRQFIHDSGYKTDAETSFPPGAKGWDPAQQMLTLKKDFSWKNAGFEQTDEHPVVNVSWRDAEAFCKWLSHKEDKEYRLPTEAEWEYACRAGTTTRYYSGDDPKTLAKVANIADATFKAGFPWFNDTLDPIETSDGYVYTSPVGQFKPNAFGLYDMHGNVWQLCADIYDDEYYRKSPTDDPKGPDAGCDHVIRGGSWLTCPYFTLSSTRTRVEPSDRCNNIGFRVVRVVASCTKTLTNDKSMPAEETNQQGPKQ